MLNGKEIKSIKNMVITNARKDGIFWWECNI